MGVIHKHNIYLYIYVDINGVLLSLRLLVFDTYFIYSLVLNPFPYEICDGLSTSKYVSSFMYASHNAFYFRVLVGRTQKGRTVFKGG